MGRGGAERVTANLANHWAGKAWQITIATVAAPPDNCYPLHPTIRRATINLAGPSPNMGYGLVRNLQRAIALRRLIRQIEPDIAIAMMSTACVTLAAASLGLTKMVPLGSIRSHPADRPAKAVWKGLQLIAFGQLRAIVAQTQTTGAWLAANTTSRRIEVIPNPVSWPLAESEPRIKPDSFCKDARKLLLGVGRLVPEKGFNLLVKAYALIAEKHPNWDLAIVGEGPERQGLESQIRARGIKSRVHMPGWAGNMPDWYNRADLYVMTSRFEGFPNTLVEAAAHGLPAVSFDCDAGPRDIVCDDQNGLLVPAGDVPALADALDRLMGDEDLRKRFAVAARTNRHRFSIESISSMWEKLFADLLGVR